MATTFLKITKKAIKYWYLPLIAGILLIILGVWVFFTPASSFVALSLLFTCSFILFGLFDLMLAIINRHEWEDWGWALVRGILSVILGVILVCHPGVSMVVLAAYVGFWALFNSILVTVAAINFKHYGIDDWGYRLILGIVGILLSFFLLTNLTLAGMTHVIWAALSLMILGVENMYTAAKLKSLHNLPEKISEELKDKYLSIQKEIQEGLKESK